MHIFAIVSDSVVDIFSLVQSMSSLCIDHIEWMFKMDSVNRKFQENPRNSSNFVSNLFFSWTIPIFKRTYYKILDANDVSEPLTQDRSNVLGDRLERYAFKAGMSHWNQIKTTTLFHLFREWHEECMKSEKPSLVRAIIKTFRFECLVMGILCFVNDVVLRLILPFYLEHLLLFFRYNKFFIHKISVKKKNSLTFQLIKAKTPMCLAMTH